MNVSGRLLARNTLLNILGQAIPAIVAVVAIPATKLRLGPEAFGLIGLAWVVLGYFSYLDLGMSYAATRLLSQSVGRGDVRRMPAIVGSAALVQCGMGLIGTLTVLGGAPFIAAHLSGITPALQLDAVRTFRILALALPVVLVTASLRAVLASGQRFALINAVTIPASVLNFLIPLAGAMSGWSLARIATMLLAARVAVMLGFLVAAAQTVPGLVSQAMPERAIVRQLLGFGLWTAVTNALAPLFGSMDRLLLGTLRDVRAVGYYTSPQELVLRLSVLPASLTATLFPALTTLDAQNETGRVRDLYARSVRFLAFSVGGAALVLVALGPDILNAWLGAEDARQAGVALQFLAVGILINAISYVPSAFLHSINRPDLPAKMHLLELPVFLFLCWLLMPRYGAAGAGAVWALRAGMDATLLFVASHRNGMPTSQAPRPWLAPAVVVSSLLGAAAIAHLVAEPGLRVGASAALASLFALAGWRLLFTLEDRRHLRSLLNKPSVA